MAYRAFGPHILFKQIAEDPFGHLYRAAEFGQGGLGRVVWLRAFDGPGVRSEDVRGALDTATRIGAILKAANVAAAPKYGLADHVPYVAWDHASAQPLSLVVERVHSEGFPIPVDNALLIMEKLSLGLSAALAVEVEGRSLVHGLLHPALVMVSNDGEAVISGFGLGNELLGVLDTPAAAEAEPYLAPEVMMTRTTSKRGDVYSLGAILYHLLTGVALPVAVDARAEALDGAELAFDDQPIPADIQNLLRRALAPRPEDRFSSAADFKKELDKLLYGGAYSPTTFNLALFMDRLFRAEVESEEHERAEEAAVDPAPFLLPVPAPELEPVEETPARSAGEGKGLWVAIAGAAVVIAVAAVLYVLNRPAPVADTPPAPTQEQEEARLEAQQRQMQALVQEQLQQMLAEREEQIREELLTRQGKIDELQKRLADMEKKSRATGAESDEARRNREQIARQLADEEKAKREREAALERDRLKAEEEARQQIAETQQRAAMQTTPSPMAESATTPTAAVPASAGPPATAASTPAADPRPTVAATAPITVVEGQYLAPENVDSLPVVIKEYPVVWPRLALNSRRRGVVILQAMVGADGRVEQVKVLRIDHDGFGIPQAASDAVSKYVFKPATKNGVKVKTTATVTVPYAFRSR